MARFNSPLDRVRIAAPCRADWDQMIGNDRARFCGQCNLNVYNLSSMTKAEAESFIAGNEGRLCVRFYRRADGSILTNNCPVGLRAIRRRMSSFAKAISSAVLSFFAGLGVYEAGSSPAQFEPRRTMGTTMGMMVRRVDPPQILGEEPARLFPDHRVSVIRMGRVAIVDQKSVPVRSQSRRKKGHTSYR
jgi:hypothetical protein